MTRGGATGKRRPRDRYGRPLPLGSVHELAPLTGLASADEALRMAVELFDGGRFFEAHECLELVWKSESASAADRPFWKGLTQLAVACCHCQRGNARGARALLDRAAQRLAAYPSPHHGIDVRALLDAALRLRAQIDAVGASPRLEFPRLARQRG
jgi:predicted metal-dependent hydrolase